jgi:UDP-N-acetylglucosamine 2-epimerase (non-hydrolysing)
LTTSTGVKKVLSVVGARPNFMKLAPVARALAARGVEHVVVHTGQHYDPDMSEAFFRDLCLPPPDHNLDVGSSSHARQTAEIMARFEPVCAAVKPEIVLVYGDVNSTVAAALVAAKAGVRIGHVEAGLRSRDRSMPEEINRIVTDHVADILFAPSRDAVENLRAEGISPEQVHFVGNVMIDTLVAALPAARALGAPARHGVENADYTVVTLHRPANVDNPETLRELLATLAIMSNDGPVLFPVHPRTKWRIQQLRLDCPGGTLRLLNPIPYLEMLSLVAQADLVITDSGGLQEETTWLGVPCVTIRPNTERRITCTVGTNRLAPPLRGAILGAVREARAKRTDIRPSVERWDGEAAKRITGVLCDRAQFD